MPFKWYPPARVLDHMLAARLLQVQESVGQRIDRLIGLKFPAYLMPHPSKRLWLLHQHRSAYDLWDAPFSDLLHAPDGAHVRAAIRSADAAAFAGCERMFTIGHVVSDRLRRWNGVEAPPLHHPPPGADRLRPGEYGRYVLVPGRVNASKRQHLAIEALALTRQDVRLCFMGAADDVAYHAAVRARCTALGLDGRVRWMGGVGEAERLALYAGCLAVLFAPLDEDYGYVTLEAMLCAKAVLTVEDAGGPLGFVLDGETGCVCAPSPAAVAAALDDLWDRRRRTAAWGDAGRQHYAALGLGWSGRDRRRCCTDADRARHGAGALRAGWRGTARAGPVRGAAAGGARGRDRVGAVEVVSRVRHRAADAGLPAARPDGEHGHPDRPGDRAEIPRLPDRPSGQGAVDPAPAPRRLRSVGPRAGRPARRAGRGGGAAGDPRRRHPPDPAGAPGVRQLAHRRGPAAALQRGHRRTAVSPAAAGRPLPQRAGRRLPAAAEPAERPQAPGPGGGGAGPHAAARCGWCSPAPPTTRPGRAACWRGPSGGARPGRLARRGDGRAQDRAASPRRSACWCRRWTRITAT